MGLRKRYPWAVEQKELEGKGYKFNNKGECTHDPFKKKESVIKKAPPIDKKEVPPIKKEVKQEKQKKSFKESMGKILNRKKLKKRGK